MQSFNSIILYLGSVKLAIPQNENFEFDNNLNPTIDTDSLNIPLKVINLNVMINLMEAVEVVVV